MQRKKFAQAQKCYEVRVTLLFGGISSGEEKKEKKGTCHALDVKADKDGDRKKKQRERVKYE
jgi:hypothetical protein